MAISDPTMYPAAFPTPPWGKCALVLPACAATMRSRRGCDTAAHRVHTLSKNPSMTYSAGSSTSGKNGISDSLPWPCHDCRRNKKGEEKNRRRDPSWHGVQSIITNHIDISFCGGNGSVSRPPATLDRDGVRRSHRYRQIESWNRRRQKKGTGRTGVAW